MELFGGSFGELVGLPHRRALSLAKGHINTRASAGLSLGRALFMYLFRTALRPKVDALNRGNPKPILERERK